MLSMIRSLNDWLGSRLEPAQLLIGGLILGLLGGSGIPGLGRRRREVPSTVVVGLTKGDSSPTAAATSAEPQVLGSPIAMVKKQVSICKKTAQHPQPLENSDGEESEEDKEYNSSKEGRTASKRLLRSTTAPASQLEEEWPSRYRAKLVLTPTYQPVEKRDSALKTPKKGSTSRRRRGSMLFNRSSIITRRKENVEMRLMYEFSKVRNIVAEGGQLALKDIERLETVVGASFPTFQQVCFSEKMAKAAKEINDSRTASFLLSTYDLSAAKTSPRVSDDEGTESLSVGTESMSLSVRACLSENLSTDSDGEIGRRQSERRQEHLSILMERCSTVKELLFETCEISPSVQEEVFSLGASMVDWRTFDIFRLQELVARPLPFIVQYTFASLGLSSLLPIPAKDLQQVLNAWDSGYKENPFHTALHGADVTSGVYYALIGAGLHEHVSETTRLAMLIGAAVHDIGHPGVANGLLVAMQDELAVRYNDRSVLENFHAATAFEVLKSTGVQLFSALGEGQKTLRKSIVGIILGTDMSHHKEGMAELESAANLVKTEGWSSDSEATISKVVVHAVDISNPVRPWHVYQQWIPRVMEEFFVQADLEREHGLSFIGGMSFLDRRKPMNVPNFQLGFAAAVVMPLYVLLCQVEGCRFDEMKQSLEDNIAHLKEDSAVRAAELEAEAADVGK